MRVDKWTNWLTTIELDVLALHHDRRLWREFDDALACRDDSDYFRRHYVRLYIAAAAMGVRRLAYSGDGTQEISLGRLLRELIDHPGELTAARHRELFRDVAMGPDYGAERFEAEWGDGSGNLDVQRVNTDLESLKESSESVKRFADRTIAHRDPRGVGEPMPTFDELDRAVDEVGRVFNKYRALIVGSPLSRLEPVVQGDWKAPFRVAVFDATE